MHSEFYLLLTLRCFGSFKPFQFSTEILFKVQSFDMSIFLSVSFYLCVYYSSIFGNVTRMKWHNFPKECDLLLTLPFTLINNPIIITYHGNRGTCFYRGCIPNTSRFRISLLLTIHIKNLYPWITNTTIQLVFLIEVAVVFLSFLSCIYAYSSIFGNVTRMKWHNSFKERRILLKHGRYVFSTWLHTWLHTKYGTVSI